MPFCFRLRFLLLSGVVALLACGSVSEAQQADIDDLAKNLCKQIVHAKIDSIVVADFATKQAEISRQAHFLAGELSQSLGKCKKNLVLVDRVRLSEALIRAQMLPEDLTVADSLRRLGTSLQVSSLITATVEATPGQYLVDAILHNVADAGVVGSSHQSVKRPAIADGMALLASKVSPQELAVAGEDGVGIPTCIHCPPPVYTQEAREAGRQGSVVLVAIVTATGSVSKAVVTGNPGVGLANQATRVMSTWRLKPATDRQGKPLDVLVPIEVTFRLF